MKHGSFKIYKNKRLLRILKSHYMTKITWTDFKNELRELRNENGLYFFYTLFLNDNLIVITRQSNNYELEFNGNIFQLKDSNSNCLQLPLLSNIVINKSGSIEARMIRYEFNLNDSLSIIIRFDIVQ